MKSLERPRDPTHPAVAGAFDRILRQLGLRDGFHLDALLRPGEGVA